MLYQSILNESVACPKKIGLHESCLDAIRRDMINWKKVSSVEGQLGYIRSIVEAMDPVVALRNVPIMSSTNCNRVVDTICRIFADMLENHGDVIVFKNVSGDSYNINDPNWLTRKLLG